MAAAGLKRVPLLALGVLALLGAMWGGLVRLGWAMPPLAPALVSAHGPLMVTGFLGTLISLERAVALGRWWPYLAPLANGAGALTLMAGAPWPAGALLVSAGSLVLCIVFVVLLQRQQPLHLWTMAAGAAGLLAGNVLWTAGISVAQVVPLWMAFLVLTIAGERLELARVRRLSRAHASAFGTAAALLATGALATVVWHDAGVRLAGLGMVALALWLLRHDLALRGPRTDALRRLLARALALGYLWLAAGGGLMALSGSVVAGPRYDAMLHAVLLGFTFSMVFAHAPLIMPAVLGIPVSFRAVAYLPLVVLHGSLLLRVAGDLLAVLWLRQWGGLLNALAVLLFLTVTVGSVLSAITRVRRAPPSAPPAS